MFRNKKLDWQIIFCGLAAIKNVQVLNDWAVLGRGPETSVVLTDPENISVDPQLYWWNWDYGPNSMSKDLYQRSISRSPYSWRICPRIFIETEKLLMEQKTCFLNKYIRCELSPVKVNVLCVLFFSFIYLIYFYLFIIDSVFISFTSKW